MSGRFFFFIALALLLQSCAAARKTGSEQGRNVYRVNCSGLRTMEMCRERAENLCGPSGYTVLEERNGYWKRGLLVRCGDEIDADYFRNAPPGNRAVHNPAPSPGGLGGDAAYQPPPRNDREHFPDESPERSGSDADYFR